MFNSKLKKHIKDLEECNRNLDTRLSLEMYSHNKLLKEYNLITAKLEERKYRLFEIQYIDKKEIVSAIYFTKKDGGYYFHGDVGVVDFFVEYDIRSVREIEKDKYANL